MPEIMKTIQWTDNNGQVFTAKIRADQAEDCIKNWKQFFGPSFDCKIID